MAADGATGTTKAQFDDVLKLPATKSQTLEGYQNLIDKLNVIIKLQYCDIYTISYRVFKFLDFDKNNTYRIDKIGRIIFVDCKYYFLSKLQSICSLIYKKCRCYNLWREYKYSVYNY